MKGILQLVAAGLALALVFIAWGVWVGLSGRERSTPPGAATPGVPAVSGPRPGSAGASPHEPPAGAPPAEPQVAATPPGNQEPGPLEVMPQPVDGADLSQLRARSLALPVEGMKANELRDTFAEARGNRLHEALDILAPRGTRVLAVDDGRVVKLFNSARGGLTVYQFDPTETFCYYYAHLDAYAPGLTEGAFLRRGAVVGFVGTTGNAAPDTPHLHFTVFKLGPEKRWWEGTPVNPFPLWAFPAPG